MEISSDADEFDFANSNKPSMSSLDPIYEARTTCRTIRDATQMVHLSEEVNNKLQASMINRERHLSPHVIGHKTRALYIKSPNGSDIENNVSEASFSNGEIYSDDLSNALVRTSLAQPHSPSHCSARPKSVKPSCPSNDQQTSQGAMMNPLLTGPLSMLSKLQKMINSFFMALIPAQLKESFTLPSTTDPSANWGNELNKDINNFELYRKNKQLFSGAIESSIYKDSNTLKQNFTNAGTKKQCIGISKGCIGKTLTSQENRTSLNQGNLNNTQSINIFNEPVANSVMFTPLFKDNHGVFIQPLSPSLCTTTGNFRNLPNVCLAPALKQGDPAQPSPALSEFGTNLLKLAKAGQVVCQSKIYIKNTSSENRIATSSSTPQFEFDVNKFSSAVPIRNPMGLTSLRSEFFETMVTVGDSDDQTRNFSNHHLNSFNKDDDMQITTLKDFDQSLHSNNSEMDVYHFTSESSEKPVTSPCLRKRPRIKVYSDRGIRNLKNGDAQFGECWKKSLKRKNPRKETTQTIFKE